MISAGHHIDVLNILIRSIMSSHGDDKICRAAPEGSFFSRILIYILQASVTAHSAKRQEECPNHYKPNYRLFITAKQSPSQPRRVAHFEPKR